MKSTIYTILFLFFGNLIFAQENALELDGTNDYVNCGNNGSLNITGTTITLEAWIRPDAFKTNVWEGVLLGKVGGGDNGYMLRVGNNGQINFNIGDGWWNELNTPTGVLTLNTWQHVAATYDGSYMRIYKNGTEVTSMAFSSNIGSASNNLWLGDDPKDGPGRNFPGRIEEVKIWNISRSASEVIEDMNQGVCAPYPTGMVAYYRFNQGIATGNNAGLITVIDEIGVNNGTLINSALTGTNSNWHTGIPAFPPPSPAFTITAISCNSANSTITGTSGGTFSFNPIPGDGATINPITGTLTNGTGGATYTVRYSICGLSSSHNVTLPSIGNASFNYTIVCGGANATITGNIGGSFAWNPAPGDGAQLDLTNGQITEGNAGTTYFVQYTVCGTSNTISASIIDDNCWTLNQDAKYITVGTEQCIELTDEINDQLGCAWNSSTIDFSSNFTLTLDYYFGNNVNGADGNTFTFQPSSSAACGIDGSQMGAGGIPNALAIEFDTYDNDGSETNDLSCDHIAVEIDGDHPDDPFNWPSNTAPLCGPVCAKAGGGNIDDGGTYQVDINWNATTNTLEVYFDGALRLTCSHDFVTNVFGGISDVYWGATSSTGGLNNQQYFCPSSIVILPIELSSFTSSCVNESEIFEWTTSSENRVDYFQLEYTYDGLVFYEVERIHAVGNSTSQVNYSYINNVKEFGQKYYRMKVVDENGEYEYTDLISGNSCKVSSSLISTIIQNESYIKLVYSEEVTTKLVGQLGNIILESDLYQGEMIIESKSLSTGIYYLLVEDKFGNQEAKKIFLSH